MSIYVQCHIYGLNSQMYVSFQPTCLLLPDAKNVPITNEVYAAENCAAVCNV